MLTAPRHTAMHARMRAAFLLVVALALAAPGAGVAQAATLTVTTIADTGPGSLRQAIADAAPGDTITFAVSGTIQTAGLSIQKNLTISGPGPGALAISGGVDAVITVGDWQTSGLTVTIQGLTIRDSHHWRTGGVELLGRSTLTVSNMVFTKNSGGIAGGLGNFEGDLRVTNSTFTENHAASGGGIYNYVGALRVTSSVFDRNSADALGGGIYIEDFPDDDFALEATVINSTFTGNRAGEGGGIGKYEGNVRVINSTFSGNESLSPTTDQYQAGETIFSVFGEVSIKNTLFANGPSGVHCTIVAGVLTLAGVNLSDDAPGSYSNANVCNLTQVPADAMKLGPLAGNGGPTMTQALLEGSVAIDAGVDCTDWLLQPVTADQRGVTRPQGLGCDVGAFEREANTFTFSGFFRPVDNLPTINVLKAGSAVPVKFSLGGDHGLDILAAGSPLAPAVPCTPGAPTDSLTEVVTAGNSRLSYDPATLSYTYVWKTDKAWANTCRELHVKLTDGTLHKARFQFSK